MKKILVIPIFAILNCFISCKPAFNEIDNKYNVALKYFKNKVGEDKPYHVVDSLIYISQTNLFKQDVNDVERNLSELDSLELLDAKYGFEKEYYEFNLTNEVEPKFNLYFSKPIKNKLMVELINNKGNLTHSYSYLTSFNDSKLYVFTFSGDSISNVEIVDKIYN